AEALFAPDASVRVFDGAEVDGGWREFEEGRATEPLELKITCMPTALGDVVGAARRAAATHGGRWRLSGEAGTGIIRLHLEDTDAERASVLVTTLRAAVGPGHVTLPRAPVAVK